MREHCPERGRPSNRPLFSQGEQTSKRRAPINWFHSQLARTRSLYLKTYLNINKNGESRNTSTITEAYYIVFLECLSQALVNLTLSAHTPASQPTGYLKFMHRFFPLTLTLTRLPICLTIRLGEGDSSRLDTPRTGT